MRILVVDDAPVITHTLSRALEREGVKERDIDTASSGEEALAMFAALHPDVVLLDVQLPGIDGCVTASEMALEDPEARVVVITGAGRSDERVREMIAGGAFEVLEKPIHAEDLRGLLDLIERESSGAGRIQ